MQRLIRIVYRNLLPVKLRNAVELFPSLRGKVAAPDFIEKPSGRKVLILSPHPDDDIIGCGGTLHKHHLAGDHVVSIYMTDGRKGGDGSISEEEVVSIRRAEARRAAEIVGINRLIFLNNRDGELSANQKTIAELVDLIRANDPDLIYIPFLLDYHPDHIATNAIFIGALRRLKYCNFTCYGYEVWTPLVHNCLVGITKQAPVKQAALEQFESQQKRFNLLGAAFGLSRYRGIMHAQGDHDVEAFLRCGAKEYLRLWKVVRW